MSWFNVWDGLKNKTCRYLLQRYLGRFLEEKLNLEQLNVELYNGKATVKNVTLKADALNELFEAQGWSVEVTGGKIGLITVTVPWNALMTNDSSIEIADLFICLRPVQRQSNGTSMLESMWSSVSSSMQLAQECMNQSDDNSVDLLSQNNFIDGLEKFAETIDHVLSRIKASCKNVILRLEYVSESSHGIAIVIKINSLNYQNDAETEKHVKQNVQGAWDNKKNYNKNDNEYSEHTHILSTFAKHNISANGVYVYTEEFRIRCKKNEYFVKLLADDLQDYEIFYRKTLQNSFLKSKLQFEEIKNLTSIDSNKLCKSIPIPIIDIKGQQQIIFKMKQSEEISGPKVILDVELGSICLFISPRQMHLLLKFYDSFCEEQKHVLDSELSKEINEDKRLGSNIKNCSSNMTGDLTNPNVWSDNLENELTSIYSVESSGEKLANKHDYRHFESVSSSISSSSNVTSSTRFQRKVANMDTRSEISKFNVKIFAVVAVVLQEDILVGSTSNAFENPLNVKSQLDMLKNADHFFSYFNDEDSERHNLPNKIFCNKNHLCLQLSLILADGLQQRNKNILEMKLATTATTVHLHEILENIPILLIDFNREKTCSNGCNKRPELCVNMKSTTPYNFRRSGAFNSPKTELNVILEKCIIEVDISIYDRLSAIIGFSPFKNTFLKSERLASKEILKNDPCTEVTLMTTNLEIKLRFPIADVRPIHDCNRVPWWKQNIRLDFLLLCFDQFRLSYEFDRIEILANEINVFYCENAMDCKVHLIKAKLDTTLQHSVLKNSQVEYPRILLELPKTSRSCKNILSEDNCSRNCDFNCRNICIGTNLPFSAKHVCRQSDTVHYKQEAPESSETVLLPGESLEIKKFTESTMVSSKMRIKLHLPIAALQLESKQLYEIIYNRINSDLFMWESCSPIFKTSLNLQAKHEMEQSIFNVGLMDSLYVPSKIPSDPYDNLSSKKNSGCMFTSSSESEGGEDIRNEPCYKDSSSIYFSTSEKYNTIKINTSTSTACQKESNISIDVTVGRGELTFFAPTRDAENRVLPGQLGRFLIKLNTFSLFCVNGHNNNAHVAYICLQLKDLEVFHCGLVPVDSMTSIKDIDAEVPIYMQSTFYKTPVGSTKGNGKGCDKREMLSLVIEMKTVPEQKIKRLKITSGIQKTTLRYNPALPPHTWLNQLIDFLDVMDYPISGYQPYGIVTEMQLHLWDCAIDYRPKYFPYRSILEIGAFNISSNIISSMTGCTLRFVAEECVLSLAPFDTSENVCPDNKITNLPSAELVPVLNIGLLDISLRLNDKATEKCPKFDLRSSIQGVHLRTCFDSGSALAQLIAYLSNDGDVLKYNVESESKSTSMLSSFQSASELLEVRDKIISPEISKKQQERVNKLMADAVQETVTSLNVNTEVSKKTSDRGIEIFFFPDEGSDSSKRTLPAQKSDKSKDMSKFYSCETQEIENSELNDIINFEANVMSDSHLLSNDIEVEALPQIKKDLGDVTSNKKNTRAGENLTTCFDDDYCLIAEEEKSYMSNFGIKNVEVSDDPLRIVDNHFCLPSSKQDLLKSPENFPMAELRYTLCEMTFTWHLYGGNDFSKDGFSLQQLHQKVHETSKGQKTYMSDAYMHGVSYSKSAQSITYEKKPKEKLTWKTTGGCDRNYEILVEIQLSKIRFSHEVYPTQAIQASRQVLIVNEVEIRDRLQSSEINKFLYHPKSKVLPNMSNHHMIVIKALHVRPNPKLSLSQECSLRISLLPLRLNIDQDTLVFLVQFFTNLGDGCSNDNFQVGTDNDCSTSTLAHGMRAPVMTVDDIPDAVQDLHARRLVSTNLDLLMEGSKLCEPTAIDLDAAKLYKDEFTPIYFREVLFSPEVLIRFDYHGRRVELSRGPVAGLLMGLGQLQCSEIRLKKINYKRGLLGIEKLITFLCKEWLKDIKKHQLPNILSGVGPTYAIVQLFQGIYDLFWLPIEQFQKDGRLVRGLQLGAQSFTARTALAALEITSRIIQLLQFTAETAFDMVSPGTTVRRNRNTRKGKRKRLQRPTDIREGVTNAYNIVKEGFNDSANSLIEIAVAEHDQKGYTGAVGAVMRQIPQLVVCPAVLATQATNNILGGVKSSLVPEAKLEAREKWKDNTNSH